MLDSRGSARHELPKDRSGRAQRMGEMQRQVRERDLVERAAQGDDAAWTELFERYAPAIYRHVYYVSGSGDTARSVLWNIYALGPMAIAGLYMRTTPLLAWLFRLAHSLEWETLDYDLPIVKDFGLHAERLQSKPSEGLWEEIRQLPQEDRAVVVMWLVDGLTRGEIAYVLDKSLGAIEGVQRRAMLSLRELVNGAVGR